MRTLIMFGALSAMTITLLAQEAKYEFKTAIVKKEISMMGQKFEAITYVDDSGKKEANEMSLANQNIRAISEGETVISIDLNAKTANKTTLPEKPINFLQLTPAIREKHKIKELGKEDVIGKPCQKYSLEITMMGQTCNVAVWVWKGLTLKTETVVNGTTIATETVTSIEENVTVPADKFVLPDGIVVK